MDRNVVRKIIEAAEIVPGESVLEIGPGTGILTEALVAAGAKVTAVEADKDLILPLQEKFKQTITLIHGDALHYQPPTTNYKLIANIPYNITSDILFKFLTQDPKPSRMVLMVQREVADRITAKPPDMSLLSVVCQLYADVKKVTNVPASAFRPAPKVDSAVVRLDPQIPPLNPSSLEEGKRVPPPHGEGEVGGGHPEFVIRVAKAGFSSRRKQLHGNLAGARLGASDDIKRHLIALGLPSTARAENLTVHNWISLASLL